jgi:RNA polymerase sigma-70 factor (ECF subfamily)
MQTDNSTLPAVALQDVKADLLRALPKLRIFALSLCRRSRDGIEQAEDLVQEAAARALANIASFAPGSNMTGWLYTILRNDFYSRHRKRRYEVEDESGFLAAKMQTPPTQEGHIRFLELQDAMEQLRPEHRQALLLVAVSGFSYEDAAPLCACAIGTVKSRVNRARGRLAVLLQMPGQDSDPDIAWLDPSAPPDDGLPNAMPDYAAAAAGQSKQRPLSFANAG